MVKQGKEAQHDAHTVMDYVPRMHLSGAWRCVTLQHVEPLIAEVQGAKRAQRITMGKKIWCSISMREILVLSSAFARTYARKYRLWGGGGGGVSQGGNSRGTFA